MSGHVESMADLIARLYPDAELEPEAIRADLPELAQALEQTGRLLCRDRGGAPAVYEAVPGPEGSPPLVRRLAFLPRTVRGDDGRRIPADDAAAAKQHSARVASEVPVPRPRDSAP